MIYRAAQVFVRR